MPKGRHMHDVFNYVLLSCFVAEITFINYVHPIGCGC